MRKALIATIVAVALFAVGAFAAQFTVDSEDIASGSGAVNRCASNVLITFDELIPPTGAETDWTVTGATAVFHNGNPATPAGACDGFTADLALILQTGAFSAIDSVTVGAPSFASGTAEFDFSASPQDVGDIIGASVAVDGLQLPTTFSVV